MAKDSGAATQLNTHCQCANTNWQQADNVHWQHEELAYLRMSQMRSRPAALRCNVFKRRLEDWPDLGHGARLPQGHHHAREGLTALVAPSTIC